MAGKTFRMPGSFPNKKLEQPKVDFKSGGEGSEVFFSMEGMEALIANIGVLPDYVRDAAGAEMAEIAADVIARAEEIYVPYESGTLHDSGRSDDYLPGRNQNILEIGMWFGGPSSSGGSAGVSAAGAAIAEGLNIKDPSEYAAVQHETLSFQHPGKNNKEAIPVSNPQAKYLETPFLEAAPTVLPRIAAAISESFEKMGAEIHPVFAEAILVGDVKAAKD